MEITLIVPAYNEGKRIGRFFEDYLGFFKDKVKYLVVLNACRDNTKEVVLSWQKRFPDLINWVEYQEPGKGLAVRRGFDQVESDWIGVVDADDVTAASEFSKLINECETGKWDGVIASRYAPGAKVKDRVSILRRLASRIYRFIVKFLFRLPYYDTQCGAKIFKKELVKKILPDLHDDSMAFDVEVLLLCRKYGFKILEVPTIWHEVAASAFMPTPLHVVKTSLRMLWSLINLRIKF